MRHGERASSGAHSLAVHTEGCPPYPSGMIYSTQAVGKPGSRTCKSAAWAESTSLVSRGERGRKHYFGVGITEFDGNVADELVLKSNSLHA